MTNMEKTNNVERVISTFAKFGIEKDEKVVISKKYFIPIDNAPHNNSSSDIVDDFEKFFAPVNTVPHTDSPADVANMCKDDDEEYFYIMDHIKTKEELLEYAQKRMDLEINNSTIHQLYREVVRARGTEEEKAALVKQERKERRGNMFSTIIGQVVRILFFAGFISLIGYGIKAVLSLFG